MAEKIRGNTVLSGTYAEVWIDGDKIFECSKVALKVTVNREDIQLGLDVDSKMTGLKGELSLTVKKVYSRWNKYFEQMKKGLDVRVSVIAKLQDPNAKGGQIERYAADNCWFNDLPLVSYEMGGIIEEELNGGFTPSDLINLDAIK